MKLALLALLLLDGAKKEKDGKRERKKYGKKRRWVTWRAGQPGQPQTGVEKDDFLLAGPFHVMYLSYKSAGWT